MYAECFDNGITLIIVVFYFESGFHKKEVPIRMSRRRNGLLKPLIKILLCIAIVIAIGVLIYRIFFNRVYRKITLQAGTSITVEDLMRSDIIKHVPYQGELVSFTPELDIHRIGEYKARIKSGLFTYSSSVTIVDTVAPVASSHPNYIYNGYSVMPADMVSEAEDDTALNYSYVTVPSFSGSGDIELTIRLTDAAGNSSNVNSSLRICPIVPYYEAAAGSPLPTSMPSSVNVDESVPFTYASEEEVSEFDSIYNLNDILKGFTTSEELDIPESVRSSVVNNFNIYSISDFASTDEIVNLPVFNSESLSHIGLYRNYVDINGITYINFIRVYDTTAPEIIGSTDLDLYIGDNPAPEEFISSVTDSTDVTLSFDSPVDTATATAENELRSTTVVATDEFGNTTSIPCRYSVSVDEEAPLILGVSNLTTVVGESFAFRRGITVTDNHDTDLEVTVNSDEVDLNTLGTYTLYYTATDSSGNTATRSCELTVVESLPKEVTEEEVLELAQGVLDNILTADMTDMDKVTAIYWYVYDNVHYVDGFDPSSWLNAAYNGLTSGMGDCYVSASTAQALFTAAGIPNMMISKIYNGYSHHFWNLIDIGEGWHHFDATRRMHDQTSHFIYYTDEDMMAYSSIHYGSHNYDPDLYPEIA